MPVFDRYESSRLIVRESAEIARYYNDQTTRDIINDALEYFDRTADKDQIHAEMKSRFAIGIKKIDGENGYETYERGLAKTAIEQGLYETATTGIGNKIISSRAVLFSNETGHWDWVRETEQEGQQIAETDEEVADLVTWHRTLGRFQPNIIAADYTACAVESGPMLMGWSAGHLTYDSFSPACMWIVFPEKVSEDGEERAANYSSLEDAYCVVIQLSANTSVGQGSAHNNQYLAIFGASEDYERGRYVTYEASVWSSIPHVGDDAAMDWTDDAGVGNPLTVVAQENNGGPEYPIIVLRGGMSITNDAILPMSASLYNNCSELDLDISVVLHDGISVAKQTIAITRDGGSTLPRTTEGLMDLRDGNTAHVLDQKFDNVTGCYELVQNIQKQVSEGYNVPGYSVVEGESGIPESGIALLIKTRPLIKHLENRAMYARPEIQRLWEIENALSQAYSEDRKPIADISEVKQIWDPGRYVIPESLAEKRDRLEAARKAGQISYVREMRDLHNLSTDADAVKYIERMQEQNQEHPPPSGEAAQTAQQNFANRLQPRPPKTI
jgi:hypothetical protein